MSSGDLPHRHPLFWKSGRRNPYKFAISSEYQIMLLGERCQVVAPRCAWRSLGVWNAVVIQSRNSFLSGSHNVSTYPEYLGLSASSGDIEHVGFTYSVGAPFVRAREDP